MHLDAPLPRLLALGLVAVETAAWSLLVLDLLVLDFVGFLAAVLLDFAGESWKEEVLGTLLLGDVVTGFEWSGPIEARIVTYKNEGKKYICILEN